MGRWHLVDEATAENLRAKGKKTIAQAKAAIGSIVDRDSTKDAVNAIMGHFRKLLPDKQIEWAGKNKQNYLYDFDISEDTMQTLSQ